MAGLKALSAARQLSLWEARASDVRGVAPTGWAEIDGLLHRGGFAPGTLTVVAGRTQTRKSTWCLNLALQFMSKGYRVGWVGLDETPEQYTGKFMSILSNQPHEWLEENWQKDVVQEYKQDYLNIAGGKLVMVEGARPNSDELLQWWNQAEQPPIVFIDYASLLDRDRYAGVEVQRIGRLLEELQVWKNKTDTMTFAIHQVARESDYGSRDNGHLPMQLNRLKYGGEEIPDVVFGTYRPALDPLGNMEREEAMGIQGDSFEEETWAFAKRRVNQTRDSTFVQLLKNRPGTRVDLHGIEFVNSGEALKMRTLADTVEV